MTKKTAAIFHGTGCTADSFWIPWLKEQLEKDGYHVLTPSFPAHEDNFAHLDLWEEHLLTETSIRHFDLIVGHSAGVPFTLKLFSKGILSADHAVMVAGFINLLNGMDETHPTYPRNLDHVMIKQKCRAFTYIHSDNDPWGCDHIQGEALRQSFGGNLIIQTGEGHFGSAMFEQPYPAFPVLYAHCQLPPSH